MPNVLILMSDEHNPFFSGPYGHPTVRTPNMDRLAERGVVYENAYTPSPLCLPARSSWMSGLPVHRNQSYTNSNLDLPVFPSYGEVLAQKGVHAAYFGKVDVYARGEELGFSTMVRPGDRNLPGDINHRRRPLAIRPGARERANGYGPDEKGRIGDSRVMDDAVAWLTDTTPNLETSWCATVNVVNPHFPHKCDPELWDMYPDGGDLPKHGVECESARHPRAEEIRAHFETEYFSEEQARGLRRGYLGCVTFVDRQLGRLIDALEETGQLDDTVVAYTSDHGDMMGKFGMWWKCSLYEDAVRIPMIVAGPGFGEGRRVKTPVDLHDLRAAMFRALGVTQLETWWGEALQDIPEDDPERVAFAEYHGHGVRGASYLVRKGDWKLLYHVGAPNQLFNLAEDPDELVTHAGDAPEKAKELEAALREICDPEEEDRRAFEFQEAQLEKIAREYPEVKPHG